MTVFDFEASEFEHLDRFIKLLKEEGQLNDRRSSKTGTDSV